jgi:hypothetical protein
MSTTSRIPEFDLPDRLRKAREAAELDQHDHPPAAIERGDFIQATELEVKRFLKLGGPEISKRRAR